MFVLIVLSLLVLGAHFLRGGSWLLCLAMLAFVALLLIRRSWVARLIQIVLVLGALEWVRTLGILVSLRSQQGEPIVRMAVILASVAAVTLGSAMLFETRALRQMYGRR